MPNNMEDLFDIDFGDSSDLPDREERCQKAMKAVTKAIVMRLFIVALLIWIILTIRLDLWVIGLLLLVAAINMTGILPLAAELKKRRAEWKMLLETEE